MEVVLWSAVWATEAYQLVLEEGSCPVPVAEVPLKLMHLHRYWLHHSDLECETLVQLLELEVD